MPFRAVLRPWRSPVGRVTLTASHQVAVREGALVRARTSVADVGAAAPPSVQRARGATPLALGHRGLAHLLSSGSGRPLDDHVRQDMEARLGADLSGVRVHTGDHGHRAATALGARAFTTGTDIVFAHGAYDPSAATGRSTLAHELVHVLQQREGPVAGRDTGTGLRISDPGDRFEREATDVAARVDAQPAPGQRAAVSRPAARGGADARTALRLQRAVGNHATVRALAGRPVLQRCGPTPCACSEEQQHAAALEQVPVQRRGDVTATSIGDAHAAALSDTELADDLRLVRAQVRTLSADDPVHLAATQNLQVLEREQRRRVVTRRPDATTSSTRSAGPIGQTVPRPPGLPSDRGYRLVAVDGLPTQLLDAIPDGQLVELDLAGQGGPSPVPAGPAGHGGLRIGDITPVTQPLGVGGIAALRGSNAALRTFGFAAAGSDSIGLVAIPSVQANPLKQHWTLPDPVAPLDYWGHTAVVVRRNGTIVAVRGFNPDSGFPRGLLDLLLQRRAVESGRAALPSVVSADDYLLTHPRARTLEWAVTPELAESALHELSPTGRAGALGHADLYSARPAEYGCTSSNCGLWATEQLESRLGGAVGRTGQGPITAVGKDGVVPRTASQGRLMGLLGEAEQARLRGGASPLLEMPHAQGPGVASGMPRRFKVLKYGGRVFAVVGVAADAYELYSATPQERPRVAVGIVGATAGGAAGGALAGAAAGLLCGPGAPVCSVVLGAGGAAVGALGGRAAFQALFDSLGRSQAGPCIPAYRTLGPVGTGECPSCHRIRRVQECRDEDRPRFGAGGSGHAPFGAGLGSGTGPADHGLRTSWRTDELRSLLVAGERTGPPGVHSLSAQETQLLLRWIESGR